MKASKPFGFYSQYYRKPRRVRLSSEQGSGLSWGTLVLYYSGSTGTWMEGPGWHQEVSWCYYIHTGVRMVAGSGMVYMLW